MTHKIRMYVLRGLLFAAVTASFIAASPTFAAVLNGGGNGGGG